MIAEWDRAAQFCASLDAPWQASLQVFQVSVDTARRIADDPTGFCATVRRFTVEEAIDWVDDRDTEPMGFRR